MFLLCTPEYVVGRFSLQPVSFRSKVCIRAARWSNKMGSPGPVLVSREVRVLEMHCTEGAGGCSSNKFKQQPAIPFLGTSGPFSLCT
mmetsp:Transcript_46219/g.82546  ORF Transcript_46219/g.82546 Transcript_46219/m.82546 type:complete len:87 (-) Transcript_46219:1042-1302(-)